ncbi:MAG: hypothetical protein CMB47_05065 [Euryarchaeota archaeon]|nr:hypothetical protein [Euryarchaeota archaeon]
MSFDFKKSVKKGAKITPKKIRSKYRLRLMNRLVESQETVSELAKSVGLRMPHASAEIKRMRDEKLVSSDLEIGSRGAKIRLTEEGIKVLQMDEWYKAEEALPIPKDNDKICVLYREGTDILFAFLRQPEETLILVPDRLPDSKGNEGVSWNWAKLNHSDLRWFDLNEKTISMEEPEILDPQNIESYGDNSQIIGIARGKLIQGENIVSISTGEWFGQPDFRSNSLLPENIYHRGLWSLGTCHQLSPIIRPKDAIVAIMDDNLYKSMLLRIAKKNALLIGDLRGVTSVESVYPLDVLDYWIEIAHPRISNQEKRKRLVALKEKITTKKRIKTSDSTWRKFRKDWNDVIFDKEAFSKEMETRGLGKNAVESIVQWSVSLDNNLQLVIDLTEKISSETMLKLSFCDKLRLLIIKENDIFFKNFDMLRVDKKRSLPWLEFVTKRGETLPLKLIEDGHKESPLGENINKNINPWSLLGLKIESDFVSEEFDEEYLSVIMSSISQYPLGDESWANQMEARYPLAAWIASPDNGRWPRWQRLRERIDPEWLALLNLDFLPIEKLVEISDEAPDSVLNMFSDKLKIKLREDSDIFLRTRPIMESRKASRGVSWIAAQFLSNAPWLSENTYLDMLEWSIEAWLRNPPKKSLDAIKGVYWLFTKENKNLIEIDELMYKIKNKNKKLDDMNEVKIWSNMLDMVLDEKKLDGNEIRMIVEKMPSDWWAVESQNILLRGIRSEDGFKWILKENAPWCSTILRPKGEQIEVPGLSAKKHPGCDFTIYNEIERILNDSTSESIMDLYDSINNSINQISPTSGRTHELVGWLAQPIEKWPYFSSDELLKGNIEITKRILKKVSGYDYYYVKSEK